MYLLPSNIITHHPLHEITHRKKLQFNTNIFSINSFRSKAPFILSLLLHVWGHQCVQTLACVSNSSEILVLCFKYILLLHLLQQHFECTCNRVLFCVVIFTDLYTRLFHRRVNARWWNSPTRRKTNEVCEWYAFFLKWKSLLSKQLSWNVLDICPSGKWFNHWLDPCLLHQESIEQIK